MRDDFDGADVYDAAGDKIGTVERTYVDDQWSSRLVEVKLGSLFAKHRLVPTEGANVGNKGIQVPWQKATIENSPDAKRAGDTLEGGLLEAARAYYAAESPVDLSTDDEDAGDAAATAESDAAPEAEAGGAHQVVQEDETDDTAGERTPVTADANAEPADERIHPGEGVVLEDGTRDLSQPRDLGDIVEVPIVEEELVKRPVVKEVLRVRKDSLAETQVVSGDVRREDVETGALDDSAAVGDA